MRAGIADPCGHPGWLQPGFPGSLTNRAVKSSAAARHGAGPKFGIRGQARQATRGPKEGYGNNPNRRSRSASRTASLKTANLG